MGMKESTKHNASSLSAGEMEQVWGVPAGVVQGSLGTLWSQERRVGPYLQEKAATWELRRECFSLILLLLTSGRETKGLCCSLALLELPLTVTAFLTSEICKIRVSER